LSVNILATLLEARADRHRHEGIALPLLCMHAQHLSHPCGQLEWYQHCAWSQPAIHWHYDLSPLNNTCLFFLL